MNMDWFMLIRVKKYQNSQLLKNLWHGLSFCPTLSNLTIYYKLLIQSDFYTYTQLVDIANIPKTFCLTTHSPKSPDFGAKTKTAARAGACLMRPCAGTRTRAGKSGRQAGRHRQGCTYHPKGFGRERGPIPYAYAHKRTRFCKREEAGGSSQQGVPFFYSV